MSELSLIERYGICETESRNLRHTTHQKLTDLINERARLSTAGITNRLQHKQVHTYVHSVYAV